MLCEEDSLHGLLAGMNALRDFKGEEMHIVGDATPLFAERRDMISSQIKAVVTVKTSKGHGSGFFLDRAGHILTNEHVLNGEKEVVIVTNAGLEMSAELIRENQNGDIALLKVDILGMPTLPLAVKSDAVISEDLYAIGTPMDNMLGQSVSRGI